MQQSTKHNTLCAQWEERIKQQQASGLSSKAFCQKENISLATFYWWKRKFALGDAEATASGFVELLSKGNGHTKGKRITLHCAGIWRIEIEEGISTLYIALLVKALGKEQ